MIYDLHRLLYELRLLLSLRALAFVLEGLHFFDPFVWRFLSDLLALLLCVPVSIANARLELFKGRLVTRPLNHTIASSSICLSPLVLDLCCRA